ncbi:hypothetical protein EMCRGX_G024861 [Ephydatia muelleri]
MASEVKCLREKSKTLFYHKKNKAKARARYKADPEKKKASVRDSYKANPEKKKASLRDSYKVDPEKKDSVRDSYKADPEKKKASRYQEDVEDNRAAKRQRYQEDVEENRAAKRQTYEDNSAAIKASERNRYWNDPAVRLAKRAAERKRYRRGHQTTTTTQSYSLYEPKSHPPNSALCLLRLRTKKMQNLEFERFLEEESEDDYILLLLFPLRSTS